MNSSYAVVKVTKEGYIERESSGKTGFLPNSTKYIMRILDQLTCHYAWLLSIKHSSSSTLIRTLSSPSYLKCVKLYYSLSRVSLWPIPHTGCFLVSNCPE